MKKILYILFTASLLAVSCTEEIPVTRDHDIDAEVTDMQTKMEMTTLYCNQIGSYQHYSTPKPFLTVICNQTVFHFGNCLILSGAWNQLAYLFVVIVYNCGHCCFYH